MPERPLAFIDWGSTNMRAWLCAPDGQILDCRRSESGVTRIAREEITGILHGLLDGWSAFAPALPTNILMSGMIGSDNGFKMVPYRTCPAGIKDIAPEAPVFQDGRMRLWIIPGVSVNSKDNANVMRGEETLLIGARGLAGPGVFLLPGTHSKWVEMKENAISGFHTVMTGELYHLLMAESLIGRNAAAQAEDGKAFLDAASRGLETDRALSRLFEIRGAYLLGQIPKEHAGEALSGLLIGSEVREMSGIYRPSGRTEIVLIAEGDLARRYSAVLDLAGMPHRIVDSAGAFLLGIRSIANELFL